jgi:hypothetical protein
MIKDILKTPLIKIGLSIAIVICAYGAAVSLLYVSKGNAIYMLLLGGAFTVARQWIFVDDKKAK